LFLKLAADLVQHLADVGHGLVQILHHGHFQFTSCQFVWAKLLAGHAAHFADGLHGTDQVLLDIHIKYLQN